MTKYSDWILHDGGECPVPEGTMWQVMRREDSATSVEDRDPIDLCARRWEHAKPEDTGIYPCFDIFAYRTVIEPKTYDVWVCWHKVYGPQVYRTYEEADADDTVFRAAGPEKVTLTEGESE